MEQDSRQLLEQLVAIPSVSGHEARASDFVAERLAAAAFSVTIQPVAENRYNVLAQKGTGRPLLLFGHLDTVSEKPGWETNPYEVTQKGDKLYGLGTWDMKAGVAAILAAVQDFEPNNIQLKLAFVVDEEEISSGMHTLVQSGWLTDVYGAVASEPGFTYGLRGIALGRIGRSVYRIAVQTDGGHVYLINERTNAITEGYKVLDLLQKEVAVHNNEHLGESILFPRLVQGGAASMAIPDNVMFEIESQLVPPQTVDGLRDEIASVIRKAIEKGQISAKVAVEKVARQTPFCEPYAIDQTAAFVQSVATALRRTIRQEPTYYYRRSVADENRVAALGIPTVTVGPEGDNAHEANEWVSAKSLQKLEEFFRDFLRQEDTR